MAILSLTPNNDKKNGTAGADSINGLAGNDAISGLAGNDTLLGGIGNDYLDGGTDNDLLIGDAGNDTLLGMAGNDALDGGADNDKLDGGAGADTLNGGTAADSLSGGDGNDVYFVDNIGDRVIELAKSTSGKDTVKSSISYTLPVNVENLELTGLTNLNGIGNLAANKITGNEGDNLLNGGDGFDTLLGGDGDDTLNGGNGADTLTGGNGSDTYQINSKEDRIIETANDGDQDVVESSITYTLPAFVEILTLTGMATIDGIGNELDNTLEGNDASNELKGEDGNDSLTGHAGDDTLTGGAGDDTLDGGDGQDQVEYSGKQGDYNIIPGDEPETWVVEDSTGNEGSDRLTGIETLVFADTGEVDLGEYGSAPPELGFDDISITEGNSGSKFVSVDFRLSKTTTEPVSVDFSTMDATATAGSDYEAQLSGVLRFEVGETRKKIDIKVLGDTEMETDETFFLRLGNPVGLELQKNTAKITLTNDDKPKVSITGLSTPEGNSGINTVLATVSLSASATDPVSVQYNTVDGTALAGSGDYTTAQGTLNFLKGEKSKTISLSIRGDTGIEPDEFFLVQLSNPLGATLDGQAAKITLTNDDSAVQPAPTLILSSDKTTFKAGDSTTLRFSFSAAPQGFDLSDVVVTGGTLSSLTPDGTGLNYTARYTPVANSNGFSASVSVPAGRYQNTQGTPGTASNTLTLTADTQAPTLTISSDRTSLKAGDTATLSFNFSETPTGFDISDISVSGGILGPLNGTEQTRTALFTPTANTNNLNASINVAANSYTDAAGNTGIVINSLSLTGDTLAPSLSISSDKTSLKAGETTMLTFSFSEIPTGFEASDISVSGGTLGTLNGNGQTRTALFTPTANTNNLNASISVATNSYTDTAGNSGIVMNSLSLTGDTQAPSLSISSDKTSLKAGETTMLTFSFSETPSGFDVSEISVSGGTLGPLNGTGQTRTALFTPTANTNNLNASISVATNSYSDSAGNSGIVINSLSLTGDTQAPSLSISSDKTSLKAGEATTLTFSFSETPSGFDVSNVRVNGGTLGNLNGTGLTRTALFTPTANTNNLNVSINVAANSYTDAVGNTGLASNSLSLTGDTQAPSLSISSDKTSLKANETAMLTFSFSEMPMGFDVGNVMVNGGTLGILNGNGQTRTAFFTPTANINNLNASISVIPNSYTDAAGNSGIVINSLSLSGDTQAPSLSISSDKTSLKVGETTTLTFSFSETPTGFEASDISVSGGTLGPLTGTGQTRTALFTPLVNTRQTGSVSVLANSYTDAVGNTGTVNNALSLTLDTVPPTLSITGTTITEGNSDTSNANVTVSLSAASSQTITVNYATLNGTATAGSDYTAASSSLTFAPGETSKTVSIPIYGDTTVESNETFQVQLSNAASAVLSATASAATVTITNDDQAVISITGTTVNEGNSGTSNANVTVSLSAASSQTITVNYATLNGTATAGSDYTAASSSLTFAPGETSKTISISVIGDTTVESDETFQVQLSNAANAVLSSAASAATVTITNDDQAVISITGTTVNEGNSDTSNANVTVSLSAASSQTITVNYATLDGTATAGSDYTAASSSLTFAPGETSKTISIPVIGDTTVESDETFQVQLSNAASAVLSTTASAATVTITNDDQAVISITGTTVNEGNSGTSNANVTVSLSAASSQPVTVNYQTADGTATADSDYVATSGQLTFAAGETSKTVAVGILGDTLFEQNETIQFSLFNPQNATLGTSSAALTINNDDTQTVSSVAGQPVIDLGSQYGKLIKPVQVDGGHWFYYWDRSGDGTSAETQGTGYANSSDYTTHDVLDQIFNQDINGKVGGGGNTNNTYRYATINGVHVALPRQGDGRTGISSYYYANGTAVGGSPASAGSTAINPTYDDLLAVWDAYNGTGTGKQDNGTPPGWGATTGYWSATPSASGRAGVGLNIGFVSDYYDYYFSYVALEVL